VGALFKVVSLETAYMVFLSRTGWGTEFGVFGRRGGKGGKKQPAAIARGGRVMGVLNWD
jgi:hypothetical protein